MSEKAKEVPPQSPMRALINLLPLLILTWYLCQNRPEKNPEYQLDVCGRSLHQIGVALEKDRLLSEEKLYTKEFDKLFADGKLAVCPVGGKESYIAGYQPAADHRSYLLVCKGAHHADASVPSDYPRIAFSVEEASSDGTSEKQEDATEERQEQEAEVTDEPKQAEEVKESPSPKATPNP